MSFGEFGAVIEGLKYRQEFDLNRHHETLIVLREILTMIYNSNVKKERQKLAKQLYPFPFETTRKKVLAAESELRARADKLIQEPKTLEEYKKFITKKE
ncbi:MAG: hypothetical protein OEM46_05285 [Ignavibacteria bacterium]|nr:hypothetical protein [Ignavibacteria bacterium]